MPYQIGHIIHERLPSLWGEKNVFTKTNLHSIEAGKLPPVHYDSFTINSHSVTHIETSAHVNINGETIDQISPEKFFGPTLVVRLQGNGYTPFSRDSKVSIWQVTKGELESGINSVLKGKPFPGKIILTSEFYPVNVHGYHDPDHVLILTEEAADYLISLKTNLYGTSWKSSDYQPGSPERPIHKILLRKAAILECLNLKDVPEGIYFLNAFPLKIEGASESPCFPVLYGREELHFSP